MLRCCDFEVAHPSKKEGLPSCLQTFAKPFVQVEILPSLEEYLTDCGRTNLMQVEQFLEYLGGIEDQALQLLEASHLRERERAKERKPVYICLYLYMFLYTYILRVCI